MSAPLLRGPATITPAYGQRLLTLRNSPALGQHTAAYYIDICTGWRLNAAYIFGMFIEESGAGIYPPSKNKEGVALDVMAMRGARNWGNIRSNPDLSQKPGGRSTRRVDSKAYGQFRGYDDWADSINDVCQILNSDTYIKLGFDAIIAKWAPPEDGNDPVQYAKNLRDWATAWKVSSKL